jgi:hypothetical protein
MTPEEIKFAYEALDVSRIALDLLEHVQEAPNTEEGMNNCLGQYHLMLEQNAPNWHICVDPISILSLVSHCMELLSDGTIPPDILERDLFEVRNIIWSPAVSPFISAIAEAMHQVIEDNEILTEWKAKTVAGFVTQHEKFYKEKPGVISMFSRILTEKTLKLIRDHPTDKRIILNLLQEEAMGFLEPAFCRDALMELNDILDKAINEKYKKPLADQLFAHIPGFMDGEG